jgi:hypothetical protein
MATLPDDVRGAFRSLGGATRLRGTRETAVLLCLLLSTGCGDLLGPPAGAIRFDGIVRSLAVAEGALWAVVSDRTGRQGDIVRIQFSTLKPETTASIEGWNLFAVVAFGSIWAPYTNEVWETPRRQGLVRVDAVTRQVRTIPLDITATTVSVGRSGLWLRNADRVMLLDPLGETVTWSGWQETSTDRVFDPHAEVDLHGNLVLLDGLGLLSADALKTTDRIRRNLGNNVTGMTFSDDHLWVAFRSGTEGFVAGIDARTLAITSVLPVDPLPEKLLWGGGYLWGLWQRDHKRTLLQIDPAAERIVRTIQPRRKVLGMAWGDGQLWLAEETYIHPIRP